MLDHNLDDSTRNVSNISVTQKPNAMPNSKTIVALASGETQRYNFFGR